MLDLRAHPDGVILNVRAQPGARASGIRGEHNGLLKVQVTQAPEKGKANQALIEVLSRALKLRKSQFELLAGETSHQKRFLVRGVALEHLRAQLEAILAET